MNDGSMSAGAAPVNVVTASVRAWTEPVTPTPRGRRGKDGNTPLPLRNIIVIDTETTTDPTQALTFGVWRHCTVDDDGRITKLSEGLFFADDLPQTDPAGYAVLVEHARTHLADVDMTHRRAEPRLTLTTRTEFVERTLYKFAWKARAHVVMFNKPFDLSRLAVSAGASRGSHYGGFNLKMWDNDVYRPRIRVKHLDSKKSLTGFTSTKERDEAWEQGKTNHGNFLDLRTWSFALTGVGHTLASACEAFDVEHGKAVAEEHGVITPDYIAYARRDVLATAELFEKLYAEHRLHPPMEPTKAMSAASMAKTYLSAMGLKPRLEVDARRITPAVLGRSMAAFYGGRAECRIRHTSVPVELHDFTSMYPTVNTLMGLWGLLTAEKVNAVDATAEVRALLDAVTLESMFDTAAWSGLVGIAEVIPDGDVLPVRAPYGEEGVNTIGVNPVTSREPGWWTIADLVASTLLTGKAPRVLRATRFVGIGKLPDLRPVELRSAAVVDPLTDDFFRRVVELRQVAKRKAPGHVDGCGCPTCALAAFLKVLANSGSYGVYSEFVTQDSPPSERETVKVFSGSLDAFDAVVPGREVPGALCFPPIAACITGAARLMLAMLERCVTDAGGVWAFCDTDSLAIVATEDGRLVPCVGGGHSDETGVEYVRSLSFEQCAAIRERFAALTPYDPSIVRDLLKPECRALCLAVSAKRYALYDLDADGRAVLVAGKFSEHGLGHLLNPSDPSPKRTNKGWISDYWSWRIGTHHGRQDPPPSWFARPGVGSHTVSSPTLLRSFDVFNGRKLPRGQVGRPVRKAYADQVKPFSFMLVGYHRGFPGGPGRLVAPYERDASRWGELVWTDLHDPERLGYNLTTVTGGDEEPPSLAGEGGYRVATLGTVSAQTYGEILASHYAHPEPKFLGADGLPCSAGTRGLLARRPTAVFSSRLIGKEANRIEEMEDGIIGFDPTLVYATSDGSSVVRAVLSTLTVTEVVEAAAARPSRVPGVNARAVQRMRAGATPGAALTVLAALLAGEALDRLDVEEHGRVMQPCRDELAAGHPAGVLAAWAVRCPAPEVVERVCGCGCGVAVVGRAVYASGRCRVAAHRGTRPPAKAPKLGEALS